MITYSEDQFLRENKVISWVTGLLVALMLLFVYALFQQLVLGIPFGSRPTSDTALIVFSILNIALLAGLLVLFWKMSLQINVDESRLQFRFVPLLSKTIPRANIKEVRVVQANMLKEYGGWGIRRGRKGWAYVMTGNQGIEVTLHGGNRFLLGSRSPEELAQALQS